MSERREPKPLGTSWLAANKIAGQNTFDRWTIQTYNHRIEHLLGLLAVPDWIGGKQPTWIGSQPITDPELKDLYTLGQNILRDLEQKNQSPTSRKQSLRLKRSKPNLATRGEIEEAINQYLAKVTSVGERLGIDLKTEETWRAVCEQTSLKTRRKNK